jgi:hypothetical protein
MSHQFLSVDLKASESEIDSFKARANGVFPFATAFRADLPPQTSHSGNEALENESYFTNSNAEETKSSSTT